MIHGVIKMYIYDCTMHVSKKINLTKLHHEVKEYDNQFFIDFLSIICFGIFISIIKFHMVF